MTRSLVVTAAAFLFTTLPTPAADPPRVVRENVEWLDVWVKGQQTALPKCKILL